VADHDVREAIKGKRSLNCNIAGYLHLPAEGSRVAVAERLICSTVF